MVCIEKRPQNVAVHQPLVLNISPVYLTGGISKRGGFSTSISIYRPALWAAGLCAIPFYCMLITGCFHWHISDRYYSASQLPNNSGFFSRLIQLYISEIKCHINGNLHNIQYVEKPSQIEQPVK